MKQRSEAICPIYYYEIDLVYLFLDESFNDIAVSFEMETFYGTAVSFEMETFYGIAV